MYYTYNYLYKATVDDSLWSSDGDDCSSDGRLDVDSSVCDVGMPVVTISDGSTRMLLV